MLKNSHGKEIYPEVPIFPLITFEGSWSEGTVTNYHEQGFSLLKNKCFETNMKIESGASGGPVLINDIVVGVNSTGYDFHEEEVPLSFITPIVILPESCTIG